ncbi:MAG: hypothetical protein BMS9Abin36_1280 [Gammaproteobacteria bacterium]|nr:MAG: hypothetical protein BMS9Abin36_1280 [Gammaproteobacteria bacterium]
MNLGKTSTFFRFGIRQKIILVLITVLLSALTVSSWMALQKEKKSILEEINRRGSDISRFVAKSLSFSVIGYDYHTIQLLLDEITTSKDIGHARVISAKGNVMAVSGNLAQSKDNQHLVMFNEDITINGNVVGQLMIGLSTDVTLQRLESQKFNLVKREALVIFLIAIGEFLALSFIIIRPVSIMSESLDNSVDEHGTITGEIPINSTDEFGVLANRFNNLRNQLNSANYALRTKIEAADEQLLTTNRQLTEQSRELQKINEELSHMAITDSLTRLYNRRHFENLMETEMAMSIRHGDINSIMIIDIDHFKNINDTYGHPEGDIVIKEVATILKKDMRKTDIACRLGGEEFVVFCKRTTKEMSIATAETLRRNISERVFSFNQELVNITVSIGITTFPGSSINSIDDFFKSADDALYYCKKNGRNQIAHSEDINSDSRSNVQRLSST